MRSLGAVVSLGDGVDDGVDVGGGGDADGGESMVLVSLDDIDGPRDDDAAKTWTPECRPACPEQDRGAGIGPEQDRGAQKRPRKGSRCPEKDCGVAGPGGARRRPAQKTRGLSAVRKPPPSPRPKKMLVLSQTALPRNRLLFLLLLLLRSPLLLLLYHTANTTTLSMSRDDTGPA